MLLLVLRIFRVDLSTRSKPISSLFYRGGRRQISVTVNRCNEQVRGGLTALQSLDPALLVSAVAFVDNVDLGIRSPPASGGPESDNCSTRWIISSSSDAEYLMKRRERSIVAK